MKGFLKFVIAFTVLMTSSAFAQRTTEAIKSGEFYTTRTAGARTDAQSQPKIECGPVHHTDFHATSSGLACVTCGGYLVAVFWQWTPDGHDGVGFYTEGHVVSSCTPAGYP